MSNRKWLREMAEKEDKVESVTAGNMEPEEVQRQVVKALRIVTGAVQHCCETESFCPGCIGEEALKAYDSLRG